MSGPVAEKSSPKSRVKAMSDSTSPLTCSTQPGHAWPARWLPVTTGIFPSPPRNTFEVAALLPRAVGGELVEVHDCACQVEDDRVDHARSLLLWRCFAMLSAASKSGRLRCIQPGASRASSGANSRDSTVSSFGSIGEIEVIWAT